MQLDAAFGHPWQILAIIGALLVIAEVFVPGFVLLPIGLGFFATALFSLLIDSWPALLAFLALAQGLLYWAFLGVRRKTPEPAARTGVEGMVGAECEVTEAIPAGGSGYVKLYGDRWQARTEDGAALGVGARARIVRTEGNKVVVKG